MGEGERNISLVGASGTEYFGKIYQDKNAGSTSSDEVIVCLSNSVWNDNHWQHLIIDIYKGAVDTALKHFAERDDVGQLILIPLDQQQTDGTDVIDDLIRQYIHRTGHQ